MKTIRTSILVVLSTLAPTVLFGGTSQAAERDCEITVVPRQSGGSTYYEITGTGWMPMREVEIQAINTRTRRGMVFFVLLVESSFSQIYVGYDPEAGVTPLASGKWHVRAHTSDCSARAKFIAP